MAGLGIAAVAAAAIGISASGAATSDSARTAPADAPKALLADGDDRLPSGAAADWVTYADHVVVVSVTGEKALQPTRTELDRGEGLIGRKVALTVDKVLWSRKDAARPAPRAWEYNAAGWAFSEGKPEQRTPVALHDRPRMEKGHQYVIALAWDGPRCSPGEAVEAGRWMGLGEGSELPFDGGVIGQGENEGAPQPLAKARTDAAKAGAVGDLEDQLAGSGAGELVAKLKAATPATKQLPLAAPCS
ncbi:hypothetical protein AB0P21_35135 [Kribbella sp. NPDC056861]|uniref:hypothetical protein n=1 Tax=Kribbella sp. NPDC056861 TaxID=3154857 RepID=UPI00343E9A56